MDGAPPVMESRAGVGAGGQTKRPRLWVNVKVRKED